MHAGVEVQHKTEKYPVKTVPKYITNKCFFPPLNNPMIAPCLLHKHWADRKAWWECAVVWTWRWSSVILEYTDKADLFYLSEYAWQAAVTSSGDQSVQYFYFFLLFSPHHDPPVWHVRHSGNRHFF